MHFLSEEGTSYQTKSAAVKQQGPRTVVQVVAIGIGCEVFTSSLIVKSFYERYHPPLHKSRTNNMPDDVINQPLTITSLEYIIPTAGQEVFILVTMPSTGDCSGWHSWQSCPSTDILKL